MRTRRSSALALLLLAWPVAAQAAPAGAVQLAQAASFAGVYAGELMGEELRFELRADGVAVVEGEMWRWQARGNAVTITTTDGEVMHGKASGGDILLTLEDGERMKLRRVGGRAGRGQAGSRRTPPPSPSGTGRAGATAEVAPPSGKAPKASLKGKRVTPAGQSASFVVPAGWRHQWGTAPSGESAYLITPPQGQQKGVIAVSMFPLSGQDADRSIRDLLQTGLHGLLAGQPYTVIEGPQEFTVDGKRAGKVIISAQSPQTGGSIEGQLGGLIAEEFAYVLLSMAPPEEAKKMRAGLDTVLATLRVPQTRENEALKSRILGCWNRYEGRTDRDSNHSDSRTYQFAPDGTYSYQGRTTINAAGMSGNSGSAEQGRFRVIGQVLHLFPSEGNPYSAPIQLQGGRLVAQGMAYLPCR